MKRLEFISDEGTRKKIYKEGIRVSYNLALDTEIDQTIFEDCFFLGVYFSSLYTSNAVIKDLNPAVEKINQENLKEY